MMPPIFVRKSLLSQNKVFPVCLCHVLSAVLDDMVAVSSGSKTVHIASRFT